MASQSVTSRVTSDFSYSDLDLAIERRITLERRIMADRREIRRRQIARARRKARIRRNRLFAGLLSAALIGGLYAGLSGSKPSLAGQRQAVLIDAETTVAPTLTVPGHLHPFAWPTQGQSAVAVLGGGLIAHSPAERRVPIASLTKMMTAYLVLQDHPLALNDGGPSLVMTAADVAAWVHSSQTDESNAPVTLGESLNEKQLLEALLLPSADNIANTLAIWDAGSVPAFVRKMNAMAHSMGLSHTQYADASGVNPASSSTAADQAVLATKLMTKPVVRAIVRLPAVGFPVAGHIRNINPALGVDGIIGVKSGFTSKAMGCLATAAYRTVGKSSALVVAVTLTQPNGLYQAARADESLIAQSKSVLVTYRPKPRRQVVGSIEPEGASQAQVALKSAVPSFVAWPGLHISQHVVASDHPSSTSVGSLVYSTAGGGVIGSADLVYVNKSDIATLLAARRTT